MTSVQQQQSTAIWLRKKLRNNEPFQLDELTPCGRPLYEALGWDGSQYERTDSAYRAARRKVATCVPSVDWVEQGRGFDPPKTADTKLNTLGGSGKTAVQLSANGLKHLLAHVPNRGLAEEWLQYLIDAEQKLRLLQQAVPRDELCSKHVDVNGQITARRGAKECSTMQAIAQSAFRGESIPSLKDRIVREKELKAEPKSINHHDHATPRAQAQQGVLMSHLLLSTMYAEPDDDAAKIAKKAARSAIRVIDEVSDGRGVARSASGRLVVPFEISPGTPMSTKRAKRVLANDKRLREEEKQLSLSA